jgi:hypothetical protein
MEKRVTKPELTLVGLTEDKTKLVLVSDDGDEFMLAADAKLRAALRGDSTRLGQLEIQMESALRPRDIQARIRAGETPEAVAVAAQTTIDKIMIFATPVLAERAHVADRAQRASVRRRAGDGAAGVLGDAVSERLRSRSVDPESVEWDAWRREDGRWTLTATYSSGESTRRAEFVYDAAGRYVVADDEESRWLVGERSVSHGPQPRASGDPGHRRLSSVTPADDELPLGADAIELVRDEPPARDEATARDGDTADLTETARALHSVNDDPAHAQGDADWTDTQASERPQRAPDPGPPAPAAEDEPSDEAKQAEQGRPARKSRGRASVPSWDEIMFGAGRD